MKRYSSMLLLLRLTFFAIALMATAGDAAQSYHEERRIYGSTKRVIEKRQTTEGECPVNAITSCKVGYLLPDCCSCDTVGNATHAFYKTPNGECRIFCKSNCATVGNSGCASCKTGYTSMPECCQCEAGHIKLNGSCIPTPCSVDQNIYFLLDGTKGNNEFCTMVIIIQILVAAFNPTASLSGTRVSTVLFPNGEHLNASVVFGTQDTCVSIVNSKLRELQQEFQKCQTPGINYDPPFPSFCGEGTSAVDGLKTIYELIPSPPTTNSAVVILTDGRIIDDDTERSNILAKLAERGVQSILAAAVKGSGSLSATVDNLRLYTLQNREEDAILHDNVIDVGVGIVERMNETGLICLEHAANVTRALLAAQSQEFLIGNFCNCHTDPPSSIDGHVCQAEYPICNGPLSIDYAKIDVLMYSQPDTEIPVIPDIPVIRIGFSPTIYSVSEDDGFAKLTIIKTKLNTSETTENITVFFYTSDVTAKAQEDYDSQHLNVTFGPDEYEKSVQVPIINDSSRERSEIFYGRLSISTQSRSLARVTIAQATIEISYNDCDCNCTFDDDRNCTCHEGYFGNGFICPDDDECQNGRYNCDINANCANTNGSYECTCNDGFFGDGKHCTSNAAENLVPCPCNSFETCISSWDNGTEMCGCCPGYKRQMDVEGNQMCQDINECDSFPCGSGTCFNKQGSFTCTCPLGYIHNFDEQQCIDLDECSVEVDDCSENATCSNTEGSHHCTCRDGFIGDGITCLNNTDCGTLKCSQLCVNTNGSLTCACLLGYYLNPSNLRECEDFDECKLQIFPCDIHAECKNTIGSYECQCTSGYRGNGMICKDIDECITGLHDCPENSNCTNLVGSFSCYGVIPIIESRAVERPNHDLSYTVGTDFCLEDMDTVLPIMTMECSLGNDPDPLPEFSFTVERMLSNNSEVLHSQMSNDGILQLNGTTLLSLFNMDTMFITVTCTVSNLFGSTDSTTVITVCDPTGCQDGVTNNCIETCNRTLSNGTTSYECGCYSGYNLNPDNTTCGDINECNMTCFESENKKCENTIGSFLCNCMEGYRENATSQACEDINECDGFNHGCFIHNLEECVNTQGDHLCQCIDGYRNTSKDGVYRCCDINECESDLHPCHLKATCTNTDGNFTCNCTAGYEGDGFTCTDINECKSGSHQCHPNATCLNTIGNYTCRCTTGYDGDGFTCTDINECKSGSHQCHPNATCLNTIGNYTCRCTTGYDGDGFTCHETMDNSELISIISGIVGSVSFLLVIGIVVAIVCICYCTRKSSDSTKEENDLTAHFLEGQNMYGESHSELLPRSITVQSSYKLNLPPYLLVHASSIKLVEPIGQGEFGIVYKGHIVKDQGNIVTDIVAIKTLKGLYDSSAVRDMLKECAKMYNFNHSNVLTLNGVCLDGGTAPYIIMPYMANGSLLAYLKNNRGTLVVSRIDKDEDDVAVTQKRLMDMCIQVAKGMEYLASMKMVHRDLAARNCMIDMNFVIKVADFGLSESIETKEYFRQDKSSHIKLPLRWLAPESMDDYVFSEKSDVWAYGVTCWEIFSGGKVPYGGVGLTDLSQLLATGQRLEKPTNDACSDQLYKFMLQYWEFEPVNRPRFANIVSALSVSLEVMAGYMQLDNISAFGGTTEKKSECRESLELVEEQSALCQSSSEKKCQDEAPVPDESSV